MSDKPEAERLQAAARKAAQRLAEAIGELEAGREVQPGKLIALSRLSFHSSCHAGWRQFILADAAQALAEGRSLAVSHALPAAEKLALFERLLACLASDCAPAVRKAEEQSIHDSIRKRFPGMTRRHVHGSRRRLQDADLLLLELASARYRQYAWPHVLTAYCISYDRCRLMLTAPSIPRLKRLLDRLHAECPQWLG